MLILENLDKIKMVDLTSLKPTVIMYDQWDNTARGISFDKEDHFIIISRPLPYLAREEDKLNKFALQNNITYSSLQYPDGSNIFFPFNEICTLPNSKEYFKTKVLKIEDGVTTQLDIVDSLDFTKKHLFKSAYTVEFTFTPILYYNNTTKVNELNLQCVQVTFYCWTKE